MESLDYDNNSGHSGSFGSSTSVTTSFHSEDADYFDDAITMAYRDTRKRPKEGNSGSSHEEEDADPTGADYSSCSNERGTESDEESRAHGGELTESATFNVFSAHVLPHAKGESTPQPSVSFPQPSKQASSFSNGGIDGVRDASSSRGGTTTPLSNEERSGTTSRRLADLDGALVEADGLASENEGGHPRVEEEHFRGRFPSLALCEASDEQLRTAQRERAERQPWYINPEEVSDPYVRARWPCRLRSIASPPSSRPSTVEMSLMDTLNKGPLLGRYSPSPQRPEGYTDGDHEESLPEEQRQQRQSSKDAAKKRTARLPLISPSVTSEDNEDREVVAAHPNHKDGKCEARSGPAVLHSLSQTAAFFSRHPAEYEEVGKGPSPFMTTATAKTPMPCTTKQEQRGAHSLVRERVRPASFFPRSVKEQLGDGLAVSPHRLSSDGCSCASSLSGRVLKQKLEERLHPYGDPQESRRTEGDEEAPSHLNTGQLYGEYPRPLPPLSSSSSSSVEGAYVEEEDLSFTKEETARHAPTGVPTAPQLPLRSLLKKTQEENEGSPVLLSLAVKGDIGQGRTQTTHSAHQLQREWCSQRNLSDWVERGYHGVMSAQSEETSRGSRNQNGVPSQLHGSVATSSGVAASSIIPDALEALASLLRNGHAPSATLSEKCSFPQQLRSPKSRAQCCQQLQQAPHEKKRSKLNTLIDSLIHKSAASLSWQEQQFCPIPARSRAAKSREEVESSARRARARLAYAHRICCLVATYSRELLLSLMLMAEEDDTGRESSGSVTLAACAEAVNRILEKHINSQRERATERLCACILHYTGHHCRHHCSRSGRHRYTTIEYATFVSSILELSSVGAAR